ncbi:MAG: mandelate racemase [Desulfobacterales bacterium]|nr:MAG: mandelate racemase [Desulfobacterales bacterium]
MSIISQIELFHVRIPLGKTFYPSWIPGYPLKDNRFDLIRITTNDGIQGYSAGPAIALERNGLGSLIAPYLLGHDATNMDLICLRLREISYLGIQTGWIEPAFWDIKGKKENLPVFKLLGGWSQPIDLYASTGEVKSPKARVLEAKKTMAQGFKTIKIRVLDNDVQADINHVKAVVDAVGDHMSIAVDANQGCRMTLVKDGPMWDLDRAKYFADACADMGVAWLEDPLPMDNYDELTQLRKYSNVPISGGKAHCPGKAELKYMIEKRCYDIFQPDVIMTGGIAHGLEVAAHCHKHGLEFVPHTWTNGIGFIVNLHTYLGTDVATDRPLEYPFNPPSWTVEKRDGILRHPFQHEHGIFKVTHDPGLGFEINNNALKKYGKLTFSMTRRQLNRHTIKDKGVFSGMKINFNRKKYGASATKK